VGGSNTHTTNPPQQFNCFTTKFGTTMQSELVNTSWSKKFQLLGNQDGGWTIILKAGKSLYLGDSLTDQHKIWYDDAN